MVHCHRGASGIGRRQLARRCRRNEDRVRRIGDPIEILIPTFSSKTAPVGPAAPVRLQHKPHPIATSLCSCCQGGAERVVDRDPRVTSCSVSPRLDVSARKDRIVEVEFMHSEQDVGLREDTQARQSRSCVAREDSETNGRAADGTYEGVTAGVGLAPSALDDHS